MRKEVRKEEHHRAFLGILRFVRNRERREKGPMVTTLQQKRTHTIKIDFADEPVTSFGGLTLVERMAQRLGLWSTLSGTLPERRGEYDWTTCVKSVVAGLLSGGHGTYAAQCVREDAALLGLLDLDGAPEEATVWRSMKQLGLYQADGRLPRVQAVVARRTLEKMDRLDLLFEGFVRVFPDGSLLEGSHRREGTKYIPEKGSGLMWSAVFVGPVLAAQRLSPEGTGEQSAVRAMLPEVRDRILKPLHLDRKALVLLDSLHGDGPTLTELEAMHLHYIAGANKLEATAKTLSEQPELVWEDTGARADLGWSESGVCECWIQCKEWPAKRPLYGRRFKREGEFLWNYSGVMSDLLEKEVQGMLDRGLSFVRAIWRLYDSKAGMETLFCDGLSDLGLHHPPCQEHVRNAGFYAAASLAWVLGTAVDAIGGQGGERGSTVRQDGEARKRALPSRMRFWRLRRELFALPGRVSRHGHELKVRLLGVCERVQNLFVKYFENICRC